MSGPSCGAMDVLDLIKALVTWLLVIFGWLVVSEQQGARELSKNTYTRLQALRDELKEIESQAVQFHTSPFDQAKLREVARAISELGVETSHLRKTVGVSTDISYSVFQLRKAITFRNFDPPGHQVQTPSSSLVEDIALAKDLLDRALLDAAYSVSSQQPSLFHSVGVSIRRIFRSA